MEDSFDGYWFFLTNVLGYPDLDPDLHGDICDILATGDVHKTLFLLPRGHLKSSCVTIGYSMWIACQDPNRTISIFGETEDLPKEFLREIREHFESNEVLRKHWGDIIPGDGERKVWTSSKLQLNRTIISRTPTFAAYSINESTAGRHPDVMILDDVVSDQTVRTEAGINRTLSRFRELQALLEPPQPEKDKVKGTLIVIGTRWHWNDLYSYIIDNLSHIYLVLKRAAIESGRIIFPQKFNEKVLDEKRQEMGPWVFSAQFLNEPVDSENATFTPGLLSKASWKGNRRQFLSQVVTNIFTAVDPAWITDGDSWGIVTGCMDQSGKLRILETARSRLRPDLALDTIVAQVLKWGSHKVGFEAVGGQEWLRKALVERLYQADVKIPVQALTHLNKRKDIRILGLVPEFEYGRLMIHESNNELRTELLQYPRGKFRDLADATEMLVRIAQAPGLKSLTVDPVNVEGTGAYELAKLTRSSHGGMGKMRNAWSQM